MSTGLLLTYAAYRIGAVAVIVTIASTEGAIAAILADPAGEILAPGAAPVLGLVAFGVALTAAGATSGAEGAPISRDRELRAVALAIGSAVRSGSACTRLAGSAAFCRSPGRSCRRGPSALCSSSCRLWRAPASTDPRRDAVRGGSRPGRRWSATSASRSGRSRRSRSRPSWPPCSPRSRRWRPSALPGAPDRAPGRRDLPRRRRDRGAGPRPGLTTVGPAGPARACRDRVSAKSVLRRCLWPFEARSGPESGPGWADLPRS